MFVENKLQHINRWIQNPHSQQNNCSLLLLWHQKYKHWIKIPCDDTLLYMKSVYCTDSQINITSNTNTFQPQVSTLKWKWNGSVLLNMFSCNKGYLFFSKRMCDSKTDCPEQEDENKCQTVVNGHKIDSMKVQHFQITSHLNAKSVTVQKLTCADSNIRCIYDIKDKQIDSFQRHCEGGEHLDLCESFLCNVTYKCPRYHCIPWHYVCDGQWDCPFGYDEEDCKPKLRSGFYHCSNSVVLILPHSICDDVTDCPEADDQQNCELHNSICPPSCFCFLSFFHCKIFSTNIISNIQSLPSKFLNLSIANMTLLLSSLRLFKQVAQLNIRQSTLPEFCLATKMFTLVHLKKIDARANDITKLGSECFAMAPNVAFVNLSRNKIYSLVCDTFLGAHNITNLVLSQNRLPTLKKCHFEHLTKLFCVNLLQNSIKTVERDIFGHSSQNIIVQSNNPAILCSAYRSRFSNLCYNSDYCFNMLATKPIQFISWVIGFVGVIINILILLHNAEKSPMFVQIACLCASHFLFLAILVELASTDAYFGDMFAIFKLEWKDRVLCQCLQFQYYFSNWSGDCSLIILAVSRYMVVYYPLESRFKNVSFMVKVISLQLGSVFAASILVTIISVVLYDQGATSDLCLPFGMKNSVVFPKVIVTVSAVLGLVCCISVPCLYWKLYHKIKFDKKQISSSQSDKYLLSVKFQSLVEIVTNTICWLARTILILFVIFGENYPDVLPLWTLALVIPVKTLIFPIILDTKFKEILLPCFTK